MARPSSALVSILFAGACADDSSGVIVPPPPPVSSVQVALGASTLRIGEFFTATAILRDDAERLLDGRTVMWRSSEPNVATVASSGQVVAVATGTTTITATSESRTGSAELLVLPALVHSVMLEAHARTLTPDYAVLVDVTLRDRYDNVLHERPITWSSSNSAVATVDTGGLVIALAEGQTTITASTEGVTGILPIEVQAPTVFLVETAPENVTIAVGQVDTLTAVSLDVFRNVLPDRPPSWHLVALPPHRVSITEEGVVTGVMPGSEDVGTSTGAGADLAEVTVSSVPVAAVTASSAALTVRVGEVAALVAQPRDEGGNLLSQRRVTWTSSNPAVSAGFPVQETLLITGLTEGTTTWTATVAGQLVHVPVTITAPLVPNRCEQIAGAEVLGDPQIAGDWTKRIFLGRMTHRDDPSSAINPNGVFGSTTGALSVNNRWGLVGNPNYTLSARHPDPWRPPILMKNGVMIATYSIRPGGGSNVSPDFAATCEFP